MCHITSRLMINQFKRINSIIFTKCKFHQNREASLNIFSNNINLCSSLFKYQLIYKCVCIEREIEITTFGHQSYL